MSGGTARCAECGAEFPEVELAAFGASLVCVTCKPRFVQRMREGALPALAQAPARFWVRVGAKLIDGVILWVGQQIVMGVLGFVLPGAGGSGTGSILALAGVSWVVSIVANLTYATWFVARRGATPGKLALGLRVVDVSGGPLTVRRALGRAGAEYVSAFTIGIGYLMVAFDDRARALHDRIASTLVVRVP